MSATGKSICNDTNESLNSANLIGSAVNLHTQKFSSNENPPNAGQREDDNQVCGSL